MFQHFARCGSIATIFSALAVAQGCGSEDSKDLKGSGGAAGSGSGGAAGATQGGSGGLTGGAGGASGSGAGGGASGGTGGASGAGGTGSGGAGGSSSGGGGSGGGPAGACTNPSDQAVFSAKDVPAAVEKCATDNSAGEPATKNCIKQIGISEACATCYDAAVQCGAANCWLDCLLDPKASDCILCQQKHCDGPLVACSGIKI